MKFNVVPSRPSQLDERDSHSPKGVILQQPDSQPKVERDWSDLKKIVDVSFRGMDPTGSLGNPQSF